MPVSVRLIKLHQALRDNGSTRSSLWIITALSASSTIGETGVMVVEEAAPWAPHRPVSLPATVVWVLCSVSHLPSCRRTYLTVDVDNGTMGTPSQYRTRLPTPARMARQSDHLQTLNPHSGQAGKIQGNQTFLPRQTLNSFSPNKPNNSNLSGYGMSAGMKVGRQQPAGMGALDLHRGRF